MSYRLNSLFVSIRGDLIVFILCLISISVAGYKEIAMVSEIIAALFLTIIFFRAVDLIISGIVTRKPLEENNKTHEDRVKEIKRKGYKTHMGGVDGIVNRTHCGLDDPILSSTSIYEVDCKRCFKLYRKIKGKI